MRRALSLSLAALMAGGQMTEAAIASADSKPARDGDVAIAQELEAARAAGSIAAYDLFIARHPDHPLAEVARDERTRLAAAKDCADRPAEK